MITILTQTARPQTFEQLAGQKIPRSLLLSISKNPDNSPKCIIMSGPFGTGKTTSIRVLARSLNCQHKRANGDACGKCEVCKTQLDQSPFYTEYDSSQLRLETIKALIDTWYVSMSNGYRIICLDECLSYHQDIMVYNKETGKEEMKPISKVADNVDKYKVLSENTDGTFSYRDIIDSHKILAKNKKMKRVHLVRLDGYSKKTTVTCSDGHIFYSNGSLVPCKNLKDGVIVDGVYICNSKDRLDRDCRREAGYEINSEQEQMILGSLLGDASLDRAEGHNTRFRYMQSLKQEEYYKEKERIVGELGSSSCLEENQGFGDYIWRGQTKSVKELNKYWDLLYDETGHKRVTRNYLDKLNPIGIAYWFMDDGSCGRQDGKYQSRQVQLATHGFSFEENQTIINYFKERWGIQFVIEEDSRGKGYYLRTEGKTSDNASKFLAMVAPFVVPSMAYKLNCLFTPGNGSAVIKPIKYNIRDTIKETSVRYQVTSVEDIDYDRKYVYDITVEGNHNYFTSGGIKSHNCHLLSKQVQSALLKVFEEPPSNTFFCLATTDVEKIIPTIRSRSLEVTLSTVGYDEMKNNLLQVASSNSIQVDDEVLDRIIKVSHGHMRNAHMEMDKYQLIGRDQYLELFKSSHDAIDRYFQSIVVRSKDRCFSSIDEILQYPLVVIQEDFEAYILNLTKSLVNEPNDIVQALGANTLKLIKYTMADWFKSCFESDVELQTGLLCLYQLMTDVPTTSTSVRVNPNARR